jgi:hypothetical protein
MILTSVLIGDAQNRKYPSAIARGEVSANLRRFYQNSIRFASEYGHNSHPQPAKMSIRILLTGVSGQVGGALVPRLSSNDLIVADGKILDLARPDAIGSVLDRLAPELIINPAAYTAVDKAEDERELAMTINGEAPTALARWAAARDVPLIHFSTDYVFDGGGKQP